MQRVALKPLSVIIQIPPGWRTLSLISLSADGEGAAVTPCPTVYTISPPSSHFYTNNNKRLNFTATTTTAAVFYKEEEKKWKAKGRGKEKRKYRQ